jgi:HEAT repeat protein/energy-coupling factor transporter ATP-binding protein EcfA2
MPKLPSLDAYSFIAGILFGMLLYFLVIEKKIIHHIVRISKNIYDRISASANLDKAESLVERAIFDKAQENHLLSAIAPLEDILVPPQLLFPPKYLYPDFYTTTSSLITQFFPYVPDWPEFSAQFPVDKIDYSLLSNINAKTLITGHPGSGKTTLLSALAIHIIQDRKNDTLPLYLSAKSIMPLLEKETDVLDLLSAAFAEENPLITSNQIFFILKDKLNDKKVILLVDDADHMHPDEIDILFEFLAKAETDLNLSKIVVATNPNAIGKGLAKHFFPLTLASWSATEQADYLSTIQLTWDDCRFPNTHGKSDHLQSAILTKWIHDDTLYNSPFNLTVRAWLLNSGSPLGFNIFDYLINAVELHAIPISELKNISLFAFALIKSKRSTLAVSEANELLAKSEKSYEYLNPFSQTELAESANSMTEVHENGFKGLLEASIITIDSFDRLSFTSPIWAGFFANLIQCDDIQNWYSNDYLNWSYANEFMRFATINNVAERWYEILFRKETPFPFNNTHLKLARFLSDLSFDHPVRNGLLKWIAKSAFQTKLPPAERAQLFAALLLSRDPSVPKLLLEFQGMPNADIRFLSTLTYAGFSNINTFNAFIEQLSDDDQNVRNAASLAFYSLNSKKSIDFLIDILLQGDEYMKQTAAESIAFIDTIKKELLSEAITSEDLLIRRAAVYGLSRITEQWSLDILSRVAIEDGQWIVRNAATQVVENQDVFRTNLIPVLPHPSNAPWLISFASKLGKGIPKSGFVKDILITALENGNVDEKISAMNYLRVIPDADVIKTLLPLVAHKNRSIQQASAIALWYIEKILGAIPMQREKRIS